MATLTQPREIVSGADLAEALGWPLGALTSKDVTFAGGAGLEIQTARIEGQGAVAFSRLSTAATDAELDAVSLYAYHSSCPWAAVADDNGIHVLSSHWLDGSNWYRLPVVNWEELARSEKMLDAFTPEGVRDSEPQRFLLQHQVPTAFLKAVDDALVERLDGWRDKAVRFSKDAASKVDEHLQTLYAQLFVLRTVEDRGIDDTVPPVKEAVITNEEFDFDRWSVIFERAKARIGSDLFEADVASTMEPHILCGIIRDLYFPKRIPGRNIQYDFSWISADVLGLAYEKYLSTVLQPAPLPAQDDLFHQPQRGVERLSIRKSAGAYYTPRYLTGYLASTCVNKYFFDAPEEELPRVIDFSCGSGSFLVAAVDQVLGHLKRRDASRAWARELIEGGHIVGIDIDPKAVTAARLHLWQRLIEEPGALPLPNLSRVIRTGDGLDSATWGDLETEYDIVLGNPPFLATTLVGNRERLEHAYVTAKGRYDFSSLFVEQAVRILKDDGLLGVVIPNRLFLNKSAEPLRTLLSQESQIQVIIDFGSTKPFDADAYVGCIVATKRATATPDRQSARVIQVRSLEPDFMTAELLEAEAHDVSTTAISSYAARQPGSAPWSLLSATEQRNRVLVEEISVRLDSIATVPQGIRTGANDLFVLEVEEDDGVSLARVRNGLGEQWFIERDLLEPVVFGSEVQRYSLVTAPRRLLYAYRNNVALGELELKERYPRTWEYFWAYRTLLSARSSLRGTGAAFFELIRPRDERWLRRPKLMIRDLAPATAFAVDQNGSSFLAGGTAVVPQDPDLCIPLAAYLNSSVVNALIRQQTPSFRGDFQKFEPGVLQSIPVLTSVLDDEDLRAQLAELAKTRIETVERVEAFAIEAEIDAVILAAADAAGAQLVF